MGAAGFLGVEGFSRASVKDSVGSKQFYVETNVRDEIKLKREGTVISAGIYSQSGVAKQVGENDSGCNTSMLEDSGTYSVLAVLVLSSAESSSVVPATPSGLLVSLANWEDQVTEVAGNKELNNGSIGYFDKAMIVVKEGKKRRHKNLIFRNMEEF